MVNSSNQTAQGLSKEILEFVDRWELVTEDSVSRYIGTHTQVTRELLEGLEADDRIEACRVQESTIHWCSLDWAGSSNKSD